MKLATEHWHIEVSSICTLKCPRCPRAEKPETLLNQQLTLDFFKNQIGTQQIQKIRKISFCGDDGDPIYCKQFLEIIKWIKSANPTIQLLIITNGSYKTSEWWQRLAGLLNQYDELHWSIDGWDQHSNSQYRMNCDWTSIVSGIETFVAHNNTTYTVVASIAFKFNENNLDNILDFAKQHNIDCWQLTKSTKFHSVYPGIYPDNDNLQPTNDDLIAQGHRFTREVLLLSDKKRPGQDLKKMYQQRAVELQQSNEYPALCYIGNKGVYLKSNGEFYPCCWTALRYDHNEKIIKKVSSSFNLNKRTFDDIINDQYWSTEFKKFDNLECRTKCVSSKLHDTQHVTEW